LKYYQQSLEISLQTNNNQGISTAYNNIGIVYYYLNDIEKSESSYLKSLDIDLELGDLSGEFLNATTTLQ